MPEQSGLLAAAAIVVALALVWGPGALKNLWSQKCPRHRAASKVMLLWGWSFAALAMLAMPLTLLSIPLEGSDAGILKAWPTKAALMLLLTASVMALLTILYSLAGLCVQVLRNKEAPQGGRGVSPARLGPRLVVSLLLIAGLLGGGSFLLVSPPQGHRWLSAIPYGVAFFAVLLEMVNLLEWPNRLGWRRTLCSFFIVLSSFGLGLILRFPQYNHRWLAAIPGAAALLGIWTLWELSHQGDTSLENQTGSDTLDY